MAIVNHFQSCPALNTSLALTLPQHHYDWIGASEVSKSAKASRRARAGASGRASETPKNGREIEDAVWKDLGGSERVSPSSRGIAVGGDKN